MPTVAEITAIGNRVVETTTRARMAAEPGVGSMLSFGLFNSDVDDAILSNLRQIETRARDWRVRGIDAATAGKEPSSGGWDGWRAAGQILADGAADQLREQKYIIPALTQTVKEIPKNARQDLKNAGAFVGDIAAGATEGFLSKAWWVVGIALIGFGAYLYIQKKVLRG